MRQIDSNNMMCSCYLLILLFTSCVAVNNIDNVDNQKVDHMVPAGVENPNQARGWGPAKTKQRARPEGQQAETADGSTTRSGSGQPSFVIFYAVHNNALHKVGGGVLVRGDWVVTSRQVGEFFSANGAPRGYVAVGVECSHVTCHDTNIYGQVSSWKRIVTSLDLSMFQLTTNIATTRVRPDVQFMTDFVTIDDTNLVGLMGLSDLYTYGTGCITFLAANETATCSSFYLGLTKNVNVVSNAEAQQRLDDLTNLRGLHRQFTDLLHIYTYPAFMCHADQGAPLYAGSGVSARLVGIWEGHSVSLGDVPHPHRGCREDTVDIFLPMTNERRTWIQTTMECSGAELSFDAESHRSYWSTTTSPSSIPIPTQLVRGRPAIAHICLDLTGLTGNEVWVEFDDDFVLRKGEHGVKVINVVGTSRPNLHVEGNTVQLRWRDSIDASGLSRCGELPPATACYGTQGAPTTWPSGSPDPDLCRKECQTRGAEGCCAYAPRDAFGPGDPPFDECAIFAPGVASGQLGSYATQCNPETGCGQLAEDLHCDGSFSRNKRTAGECLAEGLALSFTNNRTSCVEFIPLDRPPWDLPNILGYCITKDTTTAPVSRNNPPLQATTCTKGNEDRISFDLSGIVSPLDCDAVEYKITVQHCPHVDVLNAGTVFRRQCTPTSQQKQWVVQGTPFTQSRYCRPCNACQPNDDGKYQCKEGGITYTRTGFVPNEGCDCDGVVGDPYTCEAEV